MWMGVDGNDPSSLSRCRAKDPSHCPYHTAHMDLTQAEADKWMEEKARESHGAASSSLTRADSSSASRRGRLSRLAGFRLRDRKPASSKRLGSVKRTIAVLLATTAVTGMLAGCSSGADAAGASPEVAYDASQAASKLDSASVITLKLTEGKASDISVAKTYDVEADGGKVATIELKPGSDGVSWDAVMESTDGGKMGTASHDGVKGSAAIVRDVLDKQKSYVSKDRDASLFSGYEYTQGGDVGAKVKQSLASLSGKHSLKGSKAEYTVKRNWSGSSWTIREETAPSVDGDVDGVDAVMNTVATQRDLAESKAGQNGRRRPVRFHRFRSIHH